MAGERIAEPRHDDHVERTTAIGELKDPLSSLPVELAYCIFHYLPILDAWRLQIVCQRWRQILSKRSFLTAAIARWDTHDPSDSARKPGDKGTLECRVRHMQALRLGRPFYTMRIWEKEFLKDTYKQPSTDLPATHVALKGSKVAYVRDSKSLSTRRVVVYDLMSGESYCLKCSYSEHEHVCDIVLTSKIIGVMTSNGTENRRLYIFRLSDTTKEYRFSFPCVSMCDMDGDEETIVLRHSHPKSPVQFLFFYTLDKSSPIPIRLPVMSLRRPAEHGATTTSFEPAGFKYNAASQTVDIFGWFKSGTITICHIRVLSRTKGFFFTRPYGLPLSSHEVFCGFHDLGSNGWKDEINMPFVNVQWKTMQTRFPRTLNTKSGLFNRFRLPQHDTYLTHEQDSYFAGRIKKWKDCVLIPGRGIIEVQTMNGLDERKMARLRYLTFKLYEPETDWLWGDEKAVVLCNDTFLLVYNDFDENLDVYSFDEDVRPFNSTNIGLWTCQDEPTNLFLVDGSDRRSLPYMDDFIQKFPKGEGNAETLESKTRFASWFMDAHGEELYYSSDTE